MGKTRHIIFHISIWDLSSIRCSRLPVYTMTGKIAKASRTKLDKQQSVPNCFMFMFFSVVAHWLHHCSHWLILFLLEIRFKSSCCITQCTRVLVWEQQNETRLATSVSAYSTKSDLFNLEKPVVLRILIPIKSQKQNVQSWHLHIHSSRHTFSSSAPSFMNPCHPVSKLRIAQFKIENPRSTMLTSSSKGISRMFSLRQARWAGDLRSLSTINLHPPAFN
jgi:hypothetical protein